MLGSAPGGNLQGGAFCTALSEATDAIEVSMDAEMELLREVWNGLPQAQCNILCRDILGWSQGRLSGAK